MRANSTSADLVDAPRRLAISDHRFALLALAGALVAMPLPSHAASPELASTVALAAVALLAGQRWAAGIIVLGQILLVVALAPYRIAALPALPATATAVACLCTIPSFASIVPATAHLWELCGGRDHAQIHRLGKGVAVGTIAGIALLLPLL